MINELLSNPDTIQATYNIIDAGQDVLIAIPYTDISQLTDIIPHLSDISDIMTVPLTSIDDLKSLLERMDDIIVKYPLLVSAGGGL